MNNQNTVRNNVGSYKVRDYENMHIFEQKVIYELKTENEKLKSLL
jgi:hypothetical protein